ncbi:MAG TPA: hypothetical protein VIZ22_10545 [Candidatus Limnocylindrales bacterium]
MAELTPHPVAQMARRIPAAARATRTGAQSTTSALQRLPDSSLRWLAAASIGLAAGLQISGAPRLTRWVGMAPALVIGAALALRPPEPVATAAVLELVPAHAPGEVRSS